MLALELAQAEADAEEETRPDKLEACRKGDGAPNREAVNEGLA